MLYPAPLLYVTATLVGKERLLNLKFLWFILLIFFKYEAYLDIEFCPILWIWQLSIIKLNMWVEIY